MVFNGTTLCYEDTELKGLYEDLIKGEDKYKWMGTQILDTVYEVPTAIGTATSGYITTGDNLKASDGTMTCDTDSSYRYITKKETEDLITNIINDKEGEKKDMKDMKEYLCPKCGAPLKVKTSRFGVKFWGCTNYPKCNYTANYEDYKDFTTEVTNADCQNCKPHKCNETCPCYENYCECDDDVTPLDALLYGCDLKGVYINDNNNTITAVDKDGKSFSAKVSGGDEFDPRIGVALVLAYNFMGSKGAFNSAIKELMNSKQYHIEKKVKKDEKKDDNETKEQQ